MDIDNVNCSECDAYLKHKYYQGDNFVVVEPCPNGCTINRDFDKGEEE